MTFDNMVLRASLRRCFFYALKESDWMDTLKGKQIMVWTFMGNARMYEALRDYGDRMAFGRKCLMNVASAAKFSSDRTIRQYAEEIWHTKHIEY